MSTDTKQTPNLRQVPTAGPRTTPIGLRLNMSAADTMAAVRAERLAAKGRRA